MAERHLIDGWAIVYCACASLILRPSKLEPAMLIKSECEKRTPTLRRHPLDLITGGSLPQRIAIVIHFPASGSGLLSYRILFGIAQYVDPFEPFYLPSRWIRLMILREEMLWLHLDTSFCSCPSPSVHIRASTTAFCHMRDVLHER